MVHLVMEKIEVTVLAFDERVQKRLSVKYLNQIRRSCLRKAISPRFSYITCDRLGMNNEEVLCSGY